MNPTILLADSEIATLVHNQIPEFEPRNELFFDQELHNTEYLIIAAYVNSKPVGYLIGYDRWQDGSFYCWMAGVIPQYRQQGILSELIDFEQDWAKERGYKSIKIKTRNNRREMLAFLVKNNFNFLEIETRTDITDNRILLEKDI